MTRQMSANMQQCIDLCNQCHNMCEQMMSHCMEMGGDQGMRLGMMMMSCADMCRMNADMMMRCTSMKADMAMLDMCSRMSMMCADMCQMGADMCRQTNDPQLMECADMLMRCADMCRMMTPEMMMQ
ncbi:four-helix bundle copper-binding protein [Kibdelosporangium philippinense]|uniref:Four-helix bundle copper-binding protein n=1 Tax=Kibdelosporangium philippinense TaxID=211113 RepID=A0ABS8Z3F3_9PSEU|nr:four-helix bundle copper-binding protein [Kibdelosporangium philippinense]MCE7002464.1 four-helix bundle copper-binding protein [Kibdelosporangium philippinense]